MTLGADQVPVRTDTSPQPHRLPQADMRTTLRALARSRVGRKPVPRLMSPKVAQAVCIGELWCRTPQHLTITKDIHAARRSCAAQEHNGTAPEPKHQTVLCHADPGLL